MRKRVEKKDKQWSKVEMLVNIIHESDLQMPELALYCELHESQLLHYFEPSPGVFIAESPIVIERALNAGYEPISILVEEKQIEGEGRPILERCPEIPVYTADYGTLKKVTGFALTRGMLCAMRRKNRFALEKIAEEASRIAVLENVVNPTNVGAIFRSAAALGMDAVLLTAGCADPLYRRAIRVSMGTVFQIPWVVLEPGVEACEVQKYGFETVAMALTDRSIRMDDPCLEKIEKMAIILGTEGDGLCAETLDKSNYIARIPMAENVDSLNVAAASAVAFWQLRKK